MIFDHSKVFFSAIASYKMHIFSKSPNGPILKFWVVMSQNNETSQELWMLSTVTLDCQVTKIVMNSGSQL